MVFRKSYYAEKPPTPSQMAILLASYGLVGVHETVHLAGRGSPYLEELLGRAARAIDPDVKDYNDGLKRHCLPPNLR